MLDGTWRKSTRSNAEGACVEVRRYGVAVQVRDTKQRGAGPVLDISPVAWAAFITAVKDNDFNR
jgi:hypothetical protein